MKRSTWPQMAIGTVLVWGIIGSMLFFADRNASKQEHHDQPQEAHFVNWCVKPSVSKVGGTPLFEYQIAAQEQYAGACNAGRWPLVQFKQQGDSQYCHLFGITPPNPAVVASICIKADALARSWLEYFPEQSMGKQIVELEKVQPPIGNCSMFCANFRPFGREAPPILVLNVGKKSEKMFGDP